MRRALLRSLLLTGAAGGLPPRRPDQVTPSNPAGTAPGTTSSVQRVRQLIISGPGSGAFLYSGPPGSGDLVESMTEAAADPFGNPTEAGFASYDLVFGGSAQLHGAILKLFSGVTLEMQISPAGLALFNSSGALIYSVDVARRATFLYADTGSATQGALQIASAAAPGTDTFANPFPKGFTSFSASAPATFYTNLSAALLTFVDTVNAAFAPGQIGLTSVTTADDSLLLTSPLALSTDIQAQLILQRAATPGPGHAIVGNADLRLSDTSPAAPGGGVSLHSKGGHGKSLSSNDGTDYSIEQLIQEINGTLPQIISSTSQAPVQGLTVSVAARKYRIRGRLSCSMGLTAGPMGRLVVTGPAISQMEVGYWSAQNNPGGATLFTATQTAIGTLTVLTSVNQGAGSGFTVIFEGTVTFSAAGTMTLAAAESLVTSVPWQINAASYWQVTPE